MLFKNENETPLPGLSTLQHCASRFEIQQGLLSSVFKYLEEVPKSTLKQHECIVALQYDEVKLKRVMEYGYKKMVKMLDRILACK